MKTDSEFLVTGPITGADLTLVGEGTLRLRRSAAEFTGRTIVNNGAKLSMIEDASLTSTSRIELRRGGTLELDKRSWNEPTDMVADDIPIEFHGGGLTLGIDGSSGANLQEMIGSVSAFSGDSNITLLNRPHPTGATMVISDLNRHGHATMLFVNDDTETALGGDDRAARITVTNEPVLTRGIIGPWTIVHQGLNDGRRDFASYGPFGVVALSTENRPSQLNGATELDHVRLTAPPDALTMDTAIASLVTDDGGFGSLDVDLGRAALNVETGGILSSRTAFNIFNGKLTSSGDSSELVIHSNNGSRIAADIVDAATPLTLVKSGLGALHFGLI